LFYMFLVQMRKKNPVQLPTDIIRKVIRHATHPFGEIRLVSRLRMDLVSKIHPESNPPFEELEITTEQDRCMGNVIF
ncbi:hypothetical protein PMAYCL1PPCAC_25386, partial [Pristionchus mayeri]